MLAAIRENGRLPSRRCDAACCSRFC